MEPNAERERPSTELIFRLLRTLMVAYFVWGAQGGVHVAELCTILSISEARLHGLLGTLAPSGWIAHDDEAGTVWLTASGARELAQSPRTYCH